MAGFTADEMRAAIDALLRSTGVSVGHLSVTRSRDVNSVKSALFELLTTTLLMKPASFFYLAYLSSNKLAADIRVLLQALDAVTEAASGASRASQRMGSTAELTNASAALLNATAALNSAQGGVSALGPDIERATSSLGKYARRELAKNVVVQGQIQPTAEELRTQIAAQWATVLTGYPLVVERVEAWNSGLSGLSAANLPKTAAQGIVERSLNKLQELELELSGTGALGASRTALLQMLAIQAVLRRATSLQLPQATLLETSAVSRQVVSPELEATLSAPFVSDGTAGSVTTHGVVTAVTPRATNAQVRTVPLTFPGGPGVSELAVVVDHTILRAVAPPASYVDGPTAATELSLQLLPDVEVTFDATDSTLVFTADSATDISHLRWVADDADRQAFVAWAFSGVVPSASSTPITAEETIELLSTVPDLEVTQDIFTAGRWTATRSAVGGEENRLHIRVLERSGSGFTSNNTSTVVGTLDFESAGVLPGMVLVVTNAPAAGAYVIEEVSGRTLLLDAVVPTTATPDFFISPLLSDTVVVGHRVQVTSLAGSENSGFYTVTSIGDGYLNVSPPLWLAESLPIRVFNDQLTFGIRNVVPGDELEVALPWAGVVAGPTHAASVTLPDNPLVAGVRVGDTAVVDGATSVTITEIGADYVVFTPPIEDDALGWLFDFRSAGYALYTAAANVLGVELENQPSLQDVDFAVARLIRGAAYSSSVASTLTNFRAHLELLATELEDYTAPRETSIDAVVSAFREHGLDRALDYLLRLQVADVLSWGNDAVSYSTHMVRQAATAARLVTPTTKLPTSVQGSAQLVSRGFRITGR